jgi:hypothetical protein
MTCDVQQQRELRLSSFRLILVIKIINRLHMKEETAKLLYIQEKNNILLAYQTKMMDAIYRLMKSGTECLHYNHDV